MLKLFARNIDIFNISKIIYENKLDADITRTTIIIRNDNIPQHVINFIFENTEIVKSKIIFKDAEGILHCKDIKECSGEINNEDGFLKGIVSKNSVKQMLGDISKNLED